MRTTRIAPRGAAFWGAVVGAVAVLSACVPDTPVDPGTTTTTTAPATASYVYVADTNLGAIRKIDTVSLATVDTYSVDGTLGASIARIGDRLFYDAPAALGGGIGVFDMTTRANNRTYISGYYNTPLLRTSDALPGRLFVGAMGVSPSEIRSYEVSGASGVLVGTTQFSAIGSNLKDFDVSSDGTRIWVACGAPYEITEIRTSDLGASGKKYPTGPYPVAVARTGTGASETIGAGGSSNPSVFTFQADNPAVVSSYATTGETLNRGLAFSRDGLRMFAANRGSSVRLATVTRSTGSISWASLTTDVVEPNGRDTGEVAVDPGTGRVFATVLNSVVVYNPDGTYGTTLSEAGPRGMVFSATGPTSDPPRLGPPPTTTTTSTTTSTSTTTAPNLNPPTISAFTASRTSGAAPLTAALSWTVSDPDPQPLTCSLDLDDNGTYEVTVPGCTNGMSRSATFAVAGTKTVRFKVSDGVASATRTLTVSVSAASTDAFGISVHINGTMTTSQQAAFAAAAARWAQVVKTGLPDSPINVAAGACLAGAPAFSGTVDDVMIEAIVAPIDGVGGVLGSAGPCVTRNTGGLPAYGVMKFDSADFSNLESNGQLNTVVLHEMGHVLGFGTIWTNAGLLAGAGTADSRFVGQVAKGAWSAIGGGSDVPVENTGGSGTADAHWRESVFSNELMTGWVNTSSNPLSAVTAGSLADLGYGVDLAAADPFGTPVLRAPATPGLQINTELILPKFTA